MSEWFNANQTPENNETQPQPAAPVTGDTPPAEPEVVSQPAPEMPVPPAPEAPAEETPAQPEVPVTDWRANPYTAAQPAAEQPAQPASAPETPAQDAPAQPERPAYETGWYRSGPTKNEDTAAAPQTNSDTTPPPPPYYSQPTPPQPPKKRRHNGAVIALAVIGSIAIVAMLVLLVFAISGTVNTDEPISDTEGNQAIINDDAPSLNITDWADDDGGLSATEIIDANMDSTVVINVYQMQVPSGLYQYGFGSETLTQVGEATGIVMTKDGYIITNWHVVIDEDSGEAFDQINVVTNDGTEYENAKVIGADESTDLAVIKVDATDLAVAEFGDSSKLVMGARVVTLGNAGGLQWSASQGIISGLARDVYEDTGYSIKCLQTDAAINPGNSGGPLLNNSGQVVGINSAKIAAEGYEGLGFSIPINEAKAIIDDLIKYGYVRGRVELGITGYSIASNGYYGFVIRSIEDGSMLEGTRARVGDLITAIDGVKIDGYSALRSELAKHSAGDTVTLSLLRLDSRTGAETTFEVTCELKESKPKA